jgi:hypothetical protein
MMSTIRGSPAPNGERDGISDREHRTINADADAKPDVDVDVDADTARRSTRGH